MVSNLRSVPRHGRGRGEVPGAEKGCLRRGYRSRAHAAPVPGLGCKRQVALLRLWSEELRTTEVCKKFQKLSFQGDKYPAPTQCWWLKAPS